MVISQPFDERMFEWAGSLRVAVVATAVLSAGILVIYASLAAQTAPRFEKAVSAARG